MQAETKGKDQPVPDSAVDWAELYSDDDEEEHPEEVEASVKEVPEKVAPAPVYEEEYVEESHHTRRGRGFSRGHRGGRNYRRNNESTGLSFRVKEELQGAIQYLSTSHPPVEIKLNRAPQLTEEELSTQFKISPKSFVIKSKTSNSENLFRYVLEFSDIENAIQMMESFLANNIINGFEAQLFYDPPEGDMRSFANEYGRRRRGGFQGRRSRDRRTRGYDRGYNGGRREEPPEVPHFFRSTDKKSDIPAVEPKKEGTLGGIIPRDENRFSRKKDFEEPAKDYPKYEPKIESEKVEEHFEDYRRKKQFDEPKYEEHYETEETYYRSEYRGRRGGGRGGRFRGRRSRYQANYPEEEYFDNRYEEPYYEEKYYPETYYKQPEEYKQRPGRTQQFVKKTEKYPSEKTEEIAEPKSYSAIQKTEIKKKKEVEGNKMGANRFAGFIGK